MYNCYFNALILPRLFESTLYVSASMNQFRQKYYPTILQAIHLIILYIFIQSIIDFPLALVDYYKDTEYLYNPAKKILLGIGSTIFILYYGYKKSRVKLLEIFPIKKFNPLIILFLITFFWGIQNLLTDVNAFVDRIIPPPPWFWELFNKIFESDYGWIGAFMKVAVIAPVVEELIFRGVIMHGFMRNYRGYVAVLMSALLFALFHLNPWQFPATFILGLMLGWLMLSTRNIFLCIIGHSINNLLVLITITFWDQINSHPFYLVDKKNFLMLNMVVILFSVSVIASLLYFKKRKIKKSYQ